MSRSLFVRVAGAVVILVVIIGASLFAIHTANERARKEAVDRSFQRVVAIREAMADSGRIRDSDLEDIIRLVKSSDPRDVLFLDYVFAVLRQVTNPTPVQKDKIFDLATFVITSPTGDLVTSQDKARAIQTAYETGGDRAIPYIKPLLEDPDPTLRRAAVLYMDKLERRAEIGIPLRGHQYALARR